MRKLILEEWLSIDGYAQDKNGNLDFFPDTKSNKISDEDQLKFLESIDAILLGRITYELFVDFWPSATTDIEIIADKLNSIPKIVFSNTLEHAPWGNWPEAQIISGDAIAAISTLKQQQGGDMVIWGSLTLAQSLIKHGLIDEFHLQLCPTAVGSGKPLFADLSAYANFDLIDCKVYDTGVVKLHYVPKQPIYFKKAK